jgi:hypothetical protein
MRYVAISVTTTCAAWVGAAVVLVAGPAPVAAAGAALVQATPAVDPEVRAQVAVGRARVLVELRVEGDAASSGAVGRAQDAVLARLPAGHASLARRYSAIPLLALEIDAVGLRALEGMSDLVSGVKADAIARTQ